MMEQLHTITKFELELHVPAGSYASMAREQVARLCHDDLLPSLNRLFDSWTDPTETIYLDRCEITVKAKTLKELEQTLVQEVLKKIQEHYQLLLDAPAGKIIKNDSKQVAFDRWIYFLQHGHLPVGIKIPGYDQWLQNTLEIIATNTSAKEVCTTLLQSHPSARQRLILQFDTSFFKKWIAAYAGHVSEIINETLQAWRTLQSDKIWIEWASTFLHDTKNNDQAYQEIVALIVDNLINNSRSLSNTELIIIFSQKYYKQHWLHVISLLHKFLKTYPSRHPQLLKPVSEYFENRLRGKSNESLKQAIVDDHLLKGKGLPVQGNENHLASTEQGENSTDQLNSIATLPGNRNAFIENKNDELFAFDKFFPGEKKPRRPGADESVFFLDNAGLVILHPYLSTLFDALGLIHDNTFKDIACRDKAVQLLSYLVHGEEDLIEYNLVLPKIFCGMTLEEPVNRFVNLEEEEKKEAEALLAAVIQHWNALKNTSPNGLRANFLIREGKLEWKNSEWRLRVNQQIHDLLLERLPWSISIIRLPWMKHYLKTDWT